MRVALIGFAVENQAVYRHFSKKGVYPTICDQNPAVELPEGSTSNLGPKYLENLDQFDLIVRSVGIHPSVILDKNPGAESKITTATNLFFEECKTPIIGVTGTKGKGTTSTLIHKILEAAGKKSLLAGNIGVPMLDILEESAAADFVVLELSSFQLYDFKYRPDIGVCLMVVPEHLNWHSDIDDYKKSKSNLFRYQNSDDVAVFNTMNQASQEIAGVSPAKKLSYAVAPAGQETPPLCTVYEKDGSIFYHDQEVIKTDEVALLGRHNLENISAAIAGVWNVINGDTTPIKQVVSSFSGLSFRLELVREVNGVKYYNDSFATTPETAIAAIRSFSQPKIVILGGSDKGIPFDELANEVVKDAVKHVLAIGDTGPVIATKLQNLGYNNITTEGLGDMQQIVAKAHELASDGDVVLLSTGCASFDMFTDYKDRGDKFNQAVKLLA